LECRAEGDPPPSTRCTRPGDTPPHRGGTRDTPRGGPTRVRGTRVVSRADAGHYVCRATNRHGVATRDVVVTVECEWGREECDGVGVRGC
ncbi:ICAM1 protein, partial [Oxyruncus cristatus]|nr:ICAM1 protein [Oxyruncus cristatus]